MNEQARKVRLSQPYRKESPKREQEAIMAWSGDQRRSGKDRRLHERRQTARYGVRTIVVVDGITWIDLDGADRRLTIRRREDRENVVRRIVRISRP